MSGSSTSWWEDPQIRWSSGEPARAVDLLVRAYEDPAAIKLIAESVGLDWHAGPVGASARSLWVWALTEAAKRRRVLDMMAEVLHDPESEAFHTLLRALLGDRLGAANARLAVRYGLPPPPSDGPDRWSTWPKNPATSR